MNLRGLSVGFLVFFLGMNIFADNPKAFIDGQGLGWQKLGETNFINVNCDPDTWSWSNGMARCTGKPVGVIRSTVLYTNYEMVVQWRHLRSAGNSGIFAWAEPDSIKELAAGKGRLPTGIAVLKCKSSTWITQPITRKTGKKQIGLPAMGMFFPRAARI
jgi:hypothetical protein